MNEEVKNKIETLVDECMDYIFVQAHSIAETKSGDITPAQQLEYDSIKEKLTKLVIEQVGQNI